MRVTVERMYKYCKENSIKLLSNYNSDFWTDYKSNYDKFDKIFKRLFASFYPLSDDYEDVESAVEDFVEDVFNHLLINDKKYSELYRINVLDDSTYSMLDNYNVTETMSRTTQDSGSATSGARTDTSTVNTGSHTDNNSLSYGATRTKTLNGVSPFDDAHLGSSGSHISVADMYDNTSSVTESESHTDTQGMTYGAQTDTSNVTKGAQTDSTTNNGSENYTLTRVGNIGVQTPTDILDKHKNFWSVFEFYNFIFMEIAKELLLIGG